MRLSITIQVCKDYFSTSSGEAVFREIAIEMPNELAQDTPDDAVGFVRIAELTERLARDVVEEYFNDLKQPRPDKKVLTGVER